MPPNQRTQAQKSATSPWLVGLAVGFGAFVLVWPALLNRYPMLNPDSLGYIFTGRLILQSLISPHSAVPFEARAEFYSLALYALDFGGRTLWPIVFFQALLCSWILRLTVRVFAPENTNVCFFATLLPLAFMTGLSWQASWIMTDVLGGLVYLGFFLLVIAPETLSRAERWSVIAIAWWGIAAHTSHLIIAAGLWILLGLLALSRRSPLHHRPRKLPTVAGLIAFSALSQILLHHQIYGNLSLTGYHPPYLTARVIADGPGRLYLQQHCPQEHWMLCPRAYNLPESSDDIIWSKEGIFWPGMSPAERAELRAQETSFVLSSVRTYPRLQIHQSMHNVHQQVYAYGFRDFVTSPTLGGMDDSFIPNLREHYAESLQAHNALPLTFATRSQKILLVLTIPVLLLSIARTPKPHLVRVLFLAAIVAFVLAANICVCSILSSVDDRYGNRILWLAPLVAILATINLFNTRSSETMQYSSSPEN
jgi:hypothetical protein